MKIGYSQIEDVLWRNARADNRIKINGKYAKDCAKLILSLFEETGMQTDLKVVFLARGGTPEQIAIYDRLCNAFGFGNMPLDPASAKVYDWIAEQEANGQRLETFAEWAKGKDRIQFIRMYRKDAANIRIDWPRAFTEAGGFTADDIR